MQRNEVNPGGEHGIVYRTGDSFVGALATQLRIPDTFFDVHNSANRSASGRDIQDPRTWVASITPTEGAQKLEATIDIPNAMFLRFSSDGTMPENITPDSKRGMYIELLLGEARLRAVQKVMPDAYAAGQGAVAGAIRETASLRKTLIEHISDPHITNLESLMEKSEGIKINKKALAAVLPTLALVVEACQPSVLGPMAVPDGGGTGPTATEFSPTETPTPKPTETPTPKPTETPTPKPTETPVPLDIPVSVRGITFKFIAKEVTNGPVSMTYRTITPPDGYSVLVVQARYTGDLPKFSKTFAWVNKWGIDDGSGATELIDSIFWDSQAHITGMVFFVKPGSTSFIFQNTLDSPWSVDLTPLP